MREGGASAIVSALLARPGYARDFAHGLLDQACDPGTDWAIRRVAILALEHQLLLLDPAEADEFVPFLARLGFTPAPGAPCCADLLKQGYTTLDPRAFVLQLTRRLGRLAPIHEALRRADVDPAAIANFEHVASQECVLTLARAVFGPEEVVARILRHVRLAEADVENLSQVPLFTEEAAHAADQLPAYEADILARLLGLVRSWWMSPTTPSMLNALVSSPIGTLAIVIRPPGSTVEFEVKRTGLRGQHPLTVVFERRGWPLPPSHRLQGGAASATLQWEGENSALLSRQYRAVHGQPAPIGRMLQLRSVKSVPRPDGGEAGLSAWFEDPLVFGEGFAPMRRAMARSLAAFVEETTQVTSVPRSPEGRTRAFLGHVTPAQCVLIGTSALRLDKARAWLRGEGIKAYSTLAHGRAPTLEESCRFADAILREILGTYRPPAPAVSYAGYVAAAFADAENRAAADRCFRAAVASMGRLWGTLLGLRSFTEGECFVARNVGLRSVWADGAWSTHIVFMDHESTHMIAKRRVEFHPRVALRGMYGDWIHIMGSDLAPRLGRGSLAVLSDIYRVNSALAAEGRAAIIEDMRGAYRFTLRRMRDDPDVRAQFHDKFVDALLAWDEAVALYRASRVGTRQRARWKGCVRRMMSGYGLADPIIREYCDLIRRNARMLRRCPYLFDAGDGS